MITYPTVHTMCVAALRFPPGGGGPPSYAGGLTRPKPWGAPQAGGRKLPTVVAARSGASEFTGRTLSPCRSASRPCRHWELCPLGAFRPPARGLLSAAESRFTARWPTAGCMLSTLASACAKRSATLALRPKPAAPGTS